jgi:hypothetical protein
MVFYGKCEVCGKETSLQRTYYAYNMPCECHHGRHSEHVNHCKDCKPREPLQTRITMDTKKLKQVIIEHESMREAMQEFVDRVERGEVRSRYTYNKFKDILQEPF